MFDHPISPYEAHTLAEDGLSLKTLGSAPHAVTEAVTWVANELVLNAQKTYADPFRDVEVSLKLTNGTDTLTVPGFWDGANVWRVRFVCPEAGQWTYETVSTDTTDAGLHGVKGTLTCTAYTGKTELYRHGFVKTDPARRCFAYADGTPFFYLGDTHWSLGGENAGLVTKMADQRAKQGFTVVQSEPIDAAFKMAEDISEDSMPGFAAYDELFQIIAEHGLVHANASFFFPSFMEAAVLNHGGYTDRLVGTLTHEDKEYAFYEISDEAKNYLRLISRYWVARYGAYPVFWTMGQEVDAGFYWHLSPNRHWCKLNNPYLYAAEYTGAYDAYHHPLSAHQENTGHTVASSSVFRDVAAHSWWAVQWQLGFHYPLDCATPKDYYENGQGKPVVYYEGKYCYLWTKNYGARVQGWMAYLSGMCGYGWGGQDTWSYRNTYSEDADSGDGVDLITAAEKRDATYESSLTLPSSYQVGYMRAFLENAVGNWFDLVPRWNDKTYLDHPDRVLALCASTEDQSKTVCYFYQTANTDIIRTPNATKQEAVSTGTLGHLTPNTLYRYVWFDAANGWKTSEGSFIADANGCWAIGEKDDRDMVLFVFRPDNK